MGTGPFFMWPLMLNLIHQSQEDHFLPEKVTTCVMRYLSHSHGVSCESRRDLFPVVAGQEPTLWAHVALALKAPPDTQLCVIQTILFISLLFSSQQ